MKLTQKQLQKIILEEIEVGSYETQEVLQLIRDAMLKVADARNITRDADPRTKKILSKAHMALRYAEIDIKEHLEGSEDEVEQPSFKTRR